MIESLRNDLFVGYVLGILAGVVATKLGNVIMWYGLGSPPTLLRDGAIAAVAVATFLIVLGLARRTRRASEQ